MLIFLFLTVNSVKFLSENESGSNIPYFAFYFGGGRVKIYEVAK